MGREVRRVPKDWKHPKDENGHLKPLYEDFAQDLCDWNEDNAQWERGLERDLGAIGNKKRWMIKSGEYADLSWSEYNGPQPQAENYMPDWPNEGRTHYQMYETTTEGTPISPVFSTPEELARWLVDNEASAFAEQTASYEAWLKVCKGGWAPSAMVIPGKGVVSGVEGGLNDNEKSN